MKHLKRKLAATLAAATMAVGIATAPAMTASAQSFSPVGQEMAYTLAQYQAGFYSWASSTFKDGRYWNSGNPNTTTTSPCTSSNQHCTHVYGNTVRSLGYTSQLSGPNDGYSQCAGYARHLANEYFQSHTFIRDIRVANNYVPRMGDQLRINGHSIFVYGFDGNNKIWFTDCNANGDCKIRWNQTAIIDNTNHTITCSDGWVATLLYADRPMMAGDINGDLEVNHADGVASAHLAAGGLNSYSSYIRPYVKAAGDVNGDGQLTYADQSEIQNYNYYWYNFSFLKGACFINYV